MKNNYLISILVLLIFISCGKDTNSDEFVKDNTGRYLFNSDELIEVYFEENTLFLKWRGAEKIKPMKIGDNLFFVKEMNEKIKFLVNPEDNKHYIVLEPKNEKDEQVFNYPKLENNNKIPSEYLQSKNYKRALDGYLKIQQADSLDPVIVENRFNSLGYNKLRDNNFEEAKAIFKINIALYPESANVYDSYADALKRSGDTLQAITFYKKSLAIDSGNRQAKRFIEKYEKK